MPQHVCMGASLMCSFGVAPSELIVEPENRCLTSGMLAANIMDHIPIANIPPFGMCMAPTNPEVIAATAAALGVFTPMPCIPVTVAPWAPGSPTVLLGGLPALNNESVLMCAWAGVITVEMPGQVTEEIP